jgi:hypothetical protein
MLRLRLASLALASGLLFTTSGCMSTSSCDDGGRLFSRLFHSNSAPSYGMPGECGCQTGGAPFAAPMPPIMDSASMPGPMWSSKSSKDGMPLPIPITNVPNQPPQFPKNLLAQPTPFNPAN